jgi:CHRD domain
MQRSYIRSVTVPAALAAMVSLSLALAPVARAHVELAATLDVAQEVPAVGTPSTATGSATLTLEEDGTLTGEVSVQNLTGTPLAAHIHQGKAGVAGGVLFTLDQSTVAGTSGMVTVATQVLSADQQQTLFAGGMYINFHTAANPGGELRGQITVLPGQCDCDTLSARDFKKCVRSAIKALDAEGKKDEGIKALKKAIKKASCGRTKAPKKAVACCIPLNPVENIVTDALCETVPAKRCEKLGGTNAGASCIPTNPCTGSPSGAFLN